MIKALVIAAAFTLCAGFAVADPIPVAGGAPASNLPPMNSPSMNAPAVTSSATPPPFPGRSARPHGRFAMMDADHDGRVTLQEFVAFQDRMFDRIDVGHKGEIDKADVDAFIAQRQAEAAGRITRARGGRGGDAGGGQLTKLADRLADGGTVTRQQWERRAARRFSRLDVAHQGFLTPDLLQPMKGSGAGAEE